MSRQNITIGSFESADDWATIQVVKTAKDLLSKNLKRLREGLELNQNELADKVDISEQMVAKMEQGLTNPSLAMLDKMASALNIPLADFFIDEAPPFISKHHLRVSESHDFTDAAAFLNAYQDASPDIKKAVLAFLFLQESGKYLREISAEALSGLIRLLSSATRLK